MKNKLTEREKNVLYYVAQGFVNTEIAEKLHISVHTVKAHVGHIIDKLKAKDRVNAVAIAIRRKII